MTHFSGHSPRWQLPPRAFRASREPAGRTRRVAYDAVATSCKIAEEPVMDDQRAMKVPTATETRLTILRSCCP